MEIGENNFPPAKISNLGKILNVILPLLQIGAALLFLVMLFRATLIWITAGDKAENIAKAQNMMIFAVIGLLIVAFSFLFVKIIGYVLNINLPL